MKKYGLIGYPLSHSFSADYFNRKFKNENIVDVEYQLFPLPNIELFNKLIFENKDLFGLNVTIPYKKSIIKYLDFLDEGAKKIAAVNTIKIIHKSDGIKLVGYNTDAPAFEQSISKIKNIRKKKALILGTGGAANAIEFVLKKMNINYVFVSRHLKAKNIIFYSDINKQIIEEYKFIINATPVGMFPDVDKYPDIPYDFIGKDHVLFDLIYNPNETLFLKFGGENGALVFNGFEMLKLQAKLSWFIWNK